MEQIPDIKINEIVNLRLRDVGYLNRTKPSYKTSAGRIRLPKCLSIEEKPKAPGIPALNIIGYWGGNPHFTFDSGQPAVRDYTFGDKYQVLSTGLDDETVQISPFREYDIECYDHTTTEL